MKLAVRQWEDVQRNLPGDLGDGSLATALWERIEERTFGKYRHQYVALALSKAEQKLVQTALVGAFIEPARWSRDHSQVYTYLASRMLNHEGKPEPCRMRTHVPKNAHLLDDRARRMTHRTNFPTRLNDGSTVSNHDDWDAADDIVAAGFMTKSGPSDAPVYTFTDRGWETWARFERHIVEHQRQWSTTFDWGAV